MKLRFLLHVDSYAMKYLFSGDSPSYSSYTREVNEMPFNVVKPVLRDHSFRSPKEPFRPSLVKRPHFLKSLERSFMTSLTVFDMGMLIIWIFVFRGRLLKGQYFIFQNIQGQVIVFIPPEFSGEMVTVDEETPLRAQGKALQVSS